MSDPLSEIHTKLAESRRQNDISLVSDVSLSAEMADLQFIVFKNQDGAQSLSEAFGGADMITDPLLKAEALERARKSYLTHTDRALEGGFKPGDYKLTSIL